MGIKKPTNLILKIEEFAWKIFVKTIKILIFIGIIYLVMMAANGIFEASQRAREIPNTGYPTNLDY